MLQVHRNQQKQSPYIESEDVPALSLIETLLLQNLSDENCLDALRIGHSAGLKYAFRAASEMAAYNLEKIAKSPTFLLLDEAVLESILDCSKLAAESEEQILGALLIWIEGRRPESRGILLLQKIRFHLISSTCLSRIKERHRDLWPIVHNSMIDAILMETGCLVVVSKK